MQLNVSLLVCSTRLPLPEIGYLSEIVIRVPVMYVGIIILKHIIVIWKMTCSNGPNKVINDFKIFLGILITVNNCQSTHTFIGDAAPYHQTYTNTTTWIQAWWSPFFAGQPNKYTVVLSQFYLAFITTYHLLSEIIYSLVLVQFTPCQPFL